jgi:hypothetical protein
MSNILWQKVVQQGFFLSLYTIFLADLIYKKGMGSGLMVRKRPLEIIARTMAALLTRPLTIKMRTGVFKAGLEKTRV